MNKKSRNTKNSNIFSDEWQEITPVEWRWIMWNEEGEQVIGWVHHLQVEEFRDKTTGEIRENTVVYMIAENDKDFDFVRFIVPTDLRKRLTRLNTKRMMAKLDWKDIKVLIKYNGKVKTSAGYEVKTFTVKAKEERLPEGIEIPPLPYEEEQDEEFNFDF